MNIIRIIFYFYLSLNFYSFIHSQSFIEAFESLPASEKCVITLKSGEVVKGTIKSGMVALGKITSISIKDESGQKRKYKMKEGLVQSIKIKLGEFAKAVLKMQAAGKSLKSMLTTDYDEINKREWAIYELALSPKKKDKYELMQLLNPGFDNVFKVYNDPWAKETKGIGGLTGGEKKSYLVVKNGAKSIKIEKSKYKYKKQFSDLFNDCESIMNKYSSKNIKIKWEDFAKHVTEFDKDCGGSNTNKVDIKTETSTNESTPPTVALLEQPEPEKSLLPVVREFDQVEKLEYEDQFFEYESNLRQLKNQIDSLKSIVTAFEKKQTMPNLSREILDLIKTPEFQYRVELKNGTVVMGDVISESDSTLILKTQIGQLVLKKDMVIRKNKYEAPQAKVVFLGDPFVNIYPDRHEFSGKIKNVGEIRADFVRVISSLFTQTTKAAGKDSAFVKGSRKIYDSGVIADTALEPGQTATYNFPVQIKNRRRVQYHTMDIRWNSTE